MTDALERVRRTLAERDAAYSHPDYDREPLETSHLDWRDLRALCAEVERLTRERNQWEQRATDEEAAHALTAGALVGNVRSLDKLDRYRVERDQARKEVTRLTAEVERLREDAARLDWLDGNGRVEFCTKPNAMGWRQWSDTDGLTFRAAIDAALEAAHE